jgi:hypothetical protein
VTGDGDVADLARIERGHAREVLLRRGGLSKSEDLSDLPFAG